MASNVALPTGGWIGWVVRNFVGRSLAASFGVAVFGLAMLGGLTIGTTLVLPFALLPRGRRERYAMTGAVCFARYVLDVLLFLDHRVRGTLDLAPHEGALVLANHVSWLDPLLLMRHTRSNGLSKSTIFWIPFVGLYAWLSGAVFFDRTKKADRERARNEVLALVRSGHRIQVFPEGTRSRNRKLSERVYLNLAMDCHKEGLPVVCCAVWGTDDVLPPAVFGAFPGRRVDLAIGKTMRPTDFADRRTFADACWAEVARLVADFESGA